MHDPGLDPRPEKKKSALKNIIGSAKYNTFPGNGNQKFKCLVMARKIRGEWYDCTELHGGHQLQLVFIFVKKRRKSKFIRLRYYKL